ncbi:MAG: ABC transporter permease [Lachnospiraceae bacterium]
MKKYISFFRLRFNMGLQYRVAALAGMATQFVWGFMECFVYTAFYETNPSLFPMEFSAMMDYIWLQQAFLALFSTWMLDEDTFSAILNGNIAYELCRPISIYEMWFARNIANRASRAVLRCLPILVVASLLPEPYRLTIPDNGVVLALFMVTLVIGLCVTVAFNMFIYVLSFFTISPQGLRIFMISAVEFFAGQIVPLPFLPEPLRTIVECMPFAGMQNVPLRIFGGDLVGIELVKAVTLQVFWLVAMVGFGKYLCSRAEQRVVVQGG